MSTTAPSFRPRVQPCVPGRSVGQSRRWKLFSAAFIRAETLPIGSRSLLNRRPDRRIIGPGNRRSIVKNFREYYKECFEAEKPKFIRVMKAVPADQAGYRPHPRSTSAGDLVWLLATELRDAC